MVESVHRLPFGRAGWEAVGLADLAARRKATGPRLSAPGAEFVRFPAEPVEHVGDVFADAVSAVVRGVEVEVRLVDPIAFWRNGSPVTPFQQIAHSRIGRFGSPVQEGVNGDEDRSRRCGGRHRSVMFRAAR